MVVAPIDQRHFHLLMPQRRSRVQAAESAPTITTRGTCPLGDAAGSDDGVAGRRLSELNVREGRSGHHR
jgi:hypothetical protein